MPCEPLLFAFVFSYMVFYDIKRAVHLYMQNTRERARGKPLMLQPALMLES